MTNWIIGQTDRFSAAVSMRSISNLVSEYSQHDIVLWGVLQLGPPPWPDLDELWRRSPIRYVQNMRTPLLLTAAEMDLRCAMSQSEELFGAMRLLGKTVELVRFPEESHDLSRSGRPDRRVERLRRIAAWYERFLGTSSVDRPAPEEETQVLPVPAEAPREWAKTVAFGTRPPDTKPVPGSKPVEEPTAPVEIVEPEVIQPTVSAFATAEAPIIEPEALPDLPGPDAGAAEPEPEPVAASEPEPLVAEAALEPEPEPMIAEAAPELEPESEQVVAEAPPEPEPEAEPVVAEAGSFAGLEPEAEPEAEPLQPEVESEPVVATTDPVLSTWDEPAGEISVPEPPPEPQAEAGAELENQRQLEPGPVVASAAVEPAAAAAPDVSSTLVAWPANAQAALPENGAPAEAGSFEEATSVIPIWQQTDPNANPKGTVSLQAMPPEQVASGSGFAALLTFESGPFAGRIVALPNQMVTIGRAPDNDVVVGDPATSGHHGRIEVRTGSFWISDLGSTNGTLVNGEPVIDKQLSDGDMIAIGQNTVRFSLEA
jgi:hypothetical protein